MKPNLIDPDNFHEISNGNSFDFTLYQTGKRTVQRRMLLVWPFVIFLTWLEFPIFWGRLCLVQNWQKYSCSFKCANEVINTNHQTILTGIISKKLLVVVLSAKTVQLCFSFAGIHWCKDGKSFVDNKLQRKFPNYECIEGSFNVKNTVHNFRNSRWQLLGFEFPLNTCWLLVFPTFEAKCIPPSLALGAVYDSISLAPFHTEEVYTYMQDSRGIC